MGEEPPADWDYTLIYKNMLSEDFWVGNGYYTMGSLLHNQFTFSIEPDAIIVGFCNFGRNFQEM